jgi:hypothetical protein
MKRLQGVLALCVRKLSISDTTELGRRSSMQPRSLRHSLMPSGRKQGGKTRSRNRGEPNLAQGARTLQRVIYLVDPQGRGNNLVRS